MPQSRRGIRDTRCCTGPRTGHKDWSSDLPTVEDAGARFEREYLVGVLILTNGKVTNAARIAGRKRKDYQELLARHEIDPVRFRREM